MKGLSGQLISSADEGLLPSISFPYQDEINVGESGQGYALRMSTGNGLAGLLCVKQMLSKSQSAVLNADDAQALSLWFGATVPLLEFALERLVHGRREQGSCYGGQILGRRYFLTRSFPRVCPDCLRELGYCRIAWDVAITVACVRHRRMLIDHCSSCRRPISWNRPGLEVCACGCLLSMSDVPVAPTFHELLVARLVDCRMDDDFSSAWRLEDEGQAHGPDNDWVLISTES